MTSMASGMKRLVARGLVKTLGVRRLRRLMMLKLEGEPSFEFEGRPLEYFFHSYNNWRLTERAIEVPIIRSYLGRGEHRNVLEVGNVSKHYYDQFRSILPCLTVVDKFEVGYDVINKDIGDFEAEEPFDFIFSISTFEHMDGDRGRNPGHVPGRSRLVSAAADNIHHVVDRLLAPGGTFVLTAPLGYTSEWDATFWSTDLDSMPARQVRKYLMVKTSEITWKQADPEAGRSAKHGEPFAGVNNLSIVEFTK
jgi:hypothetical protein